MSGTNQSGALGREPKVSIVIPSYNMPGEYLEKCLGSIFRQHYKNIEIMIVDDGSEPEKAKIIDDISGRDERIIVLHQEKQGVSAARNNGTKLCSGDYIAYVDADDSLTPWFLEQAVTMAQQKNADVLYGMVYGLEGPDMREYPPKFPAPSCHFLSVGDDWLKKHLVGQIYKQGSVYFGRGPCARLIRAELAKRVRFPEDVTVGEDVLWNLELMKTAEVKYVTDGIWYNYFTRPESVTNRYDPEIELKLKPFYSGLSQYREYVGDQHFRFRVFCDLMKYIFNLNTGNQLNPAPFFNRWHNFSQACRRFPWNEISGMKTFRQDSFQDSLKVFLYKTGLLFPAESLVKGFRRARLNKEQNSGRDRGCAH